MMLSSPPACRLVIIYLENIYVMGCIYLAIKRVRDFFLSSPSSSRLPVLHITFWFHTYSIIELFSFSTAFVGRFSGLADFASRFISPIQARGNQWRIYGRAKVIHVKKGEHICHVKNIRDVQMDLMQNSCRDNPGNEEALKLCSGIWILSWGKLNNQGDITIEFAFRNHKSYCYMQNCRIGE